VDSWGALDSAEIPDRRHFVSTVYSHLVNLGHLSPRALVIFKKARMASSLSGVEAAKRLAAFSAVDHHVRPEHKVRCHSL